MNLYLVQHGDAVSKDVDPERPLSEKGRDDVSRVAAFISPRMKVGMIGESGKLRATQTAEILGDALGIKPEKVDSLSPLDSPGECIGVFSERSGDTMLVGHMPHLGKLASLLLHGAPEVNTVDFLPGSVLCLGRGEQGWSIQWMVRPELV